jgi:hypothetical protein
MAGPTILVTIAGTVAGLETAVAKVTSGVQSSVGKIHDAFGGLLSTLNATGVLGPFGAALDGVDRGLAAIAEHGKGLSTVGLAVGGAVAGIGAGLQSLGSKEQASKQQLQAAIEATGKSWDDYSDQIDGAIKKQEHFGNSSADTQRALQILTQATGDPAKALEYLGTASDLAAAKHESLDAAASQLGKTYNGATRMLKEFGLEAAPKAASASKELEAATKGVTTAADAATKAHQHLQDVEDSLKGKTTLTAAEQVKLRDAQHGVVDADAKAQAAHEKLIIAQKNSKDAAQGQTDTMQALSDKLKGQASAAADTFGGRLNALKAKIEDSTAQFGQKYGPAITGVGSALAGVSATLKIMEALHAAEAAGWLADAVAAGVAAVAENLALLGIPILIAAVVAGIVWMVTHWNKVKDAIMNVWNWIKNNWPLLLPILLGPIGIVVALVIKNFATIKQVIKDVIDWLSGAWNDIYAALEPVVAEIVGVFEFLGKTLAAIGYVLSIPFIIAWQLIYWGAQQVANLIVTAWNWLMGVLKAVANALAGPFQAAFNAIRAAADAVINWLYGVWNGIINFLSGVAGTIGRVLSGPWHTASDAAGTTSDTIKRIWNELIGFFGGVINQLGRMFGGMWNGITEAFRAAINALIDIWNSLHFPGIDIGPVHVAGVGAPHINHLASGGIVNVPTLALIGEAGPEAVVPLNKANGFGRSGPAVVVQNAHFNTELDIEAFMRRAAWVAQTQRI